MFRQWLEVLPTYRQIPTFLRTQDGFSAFGVACDLLDLKTTAHRRPGGFRYWSYNGSILVSKPPKSMVKQLGLTEEQVAFVIENHDRLDFTALSHVLLTW